MAVIDITTVSFTDPILGQVTIAPSLSVPQAAKINALLNKTPNPIVNNGDQLYFPAGTYLLERPLYRNANNSDSAFLPGKRHTWIGDGPGATVFKALFGSAFSSPIFSTYQTVDNKIATNLSFRDLTFDGSLDTSVQWFRLWKAGSCRFDRLEFISTPNTVIQGEQFWDTVFHDVVFDNCGSGTGPVVNLTYADGNDKSFSSSNYVRFMSTRWKNSGGLACLFKYTKGVYFHTCSLENDTENGFAQIRAENAYITSLSGSRLRGANTNPAPLITAIDSTGLLVAGCHLAGSTSNGIVLTGTVDPAGNLGTFYGGRPGKYTTDCSISGNVFKNISAPQVVGYSMGSTTANNAVANNIKL